MDRRPELDDEQRHLKWSYDCLDAMRERAAVAAPFYRATGPDPLGLAPPPALPHGRRALTDIFDEDFDDWDPADPRAAACRPRRALPGPGDLKRALRGINYADL